MKIKELLTLVSLFVGIYYASAEGYVANLDAAQSGGAGRTVIGQVLFFFRETR